jgi:hypothetical protein
MMSESARRIVVAIVVVIVILGLVLSAVAYPGAT